MADRPIIFSAPMVRALLNGRKTQTRRIILNQVEQEPPRVVPYPEGARVVYGDVDGSGGVQRPRGAAGSAVGDRLWVREAWSHSGTGVWTIATARMVGRGGVIYGADADVPGARYWPSIHMPREFSRLRLTVTAVRVHRLQEISEADAVAEGMREPSLRHRSPELAQAAWCERQVFSRLWTSLHGPDAWSANPWVVALTFTVEQANIDALREAA